MKTTKSLSTLLIGVLMLAGCSTPETQDPSAATQASLQSSDLALAERAGAPLFDGMGQYEMPITTQDADAQRYFNQGIDRKSVV